MSGKIFSKKSRLFDFYIRDHRETNEILSILSLLHLIVKIEIQKRRKGEGKEKKKYGAFFKFSFAMRNIKFNSWNSRHSLSSVKFNLYDIYISIVFLRNDIPAGSAGCIYTLLRPREETRASREIVKKTSTRFTPRLNFVSEHHFFLILLFFFC